MRRLAQLFGVDAVALQSQLDDLWHIAAGVMKDGRLSNVESWLSALRRVEGSHTYVKQSRPYDAILVVLARYAAWSGCCTSDYERVHSKQNWHFTARRRCMGENWARDETKLVTSAHDEDDAMISGAQHIWKRFYGGIRKTLRTRIDAGRPRQNLKGTMKVWVGARRSSVARETAAIRKRSFEEVAVEAKKLGTTAWTKRHTNEQEFQPQKGRAHFLSSVDQGHLLDMQVGATDKGAAVVEAARLVNLDVKRTVAQRKQEAPLKKQKPVNVRGMTVFFESDAIRDNVHESAKRLGLIAGDRLTASLFVVADPTEPGERTRWAACLRGGLLATPAFVRCDGARGACVKQMPAILCKRTIWISTQFRDSHRALYDLVRQCVHGRWPILDGRAAFEKKLEVNDRRSVRCRRTFDTIGLVTVSEKRKDCIPKRLIGQRGLLKTRRARDRCSREPPNLTVRSTCGP